jgi:hypothetical protein
MVFESVLQICLRAGLVNGETFATDASVIEADARVMRRTEDATPPDDWNDPDKTPIYAQVASNYRSRPALSGSSRARPQPD